MALIEALERVPQGQADDSQVVYVGSGSGRCFGDDEGRHLPAMVAAVTAANVGRVRIDAAAFWPRGPFHQSRLADLAQENGGQAVLIMR